MKSDLDFTTYQSPFSWRYGSDEMRAIFSEVNKRKTWRRVWVALARAQHKMGLVTREELDDLVKYQNSPDIKKAHKTESAIKHDLMSEIKTYAAQAKIGGGKLHLGATSADIEDNADIINYLKAFEIIERNLKNLLREFAKKIDENKDLICMAYTHLQPAEPTTLGYRFSIYAQDLLIDLQLLNFLKTHVKGKGIKGAVGTYASYVSLLGQKAKNMEDEVLQELQIKAFDVTSQVYPRKIDYLILSSLSSIAQSLYKFSFDVRIMQSQGFGEWMEPFGLNQVGSSAMPFKRNPQTSERICSLARYVSSLCQVAWGNAANSLLERTLDDSAAKRIIMPDAFLATDEILMHSIFVLDGLVINKNNIEKNLRSYGPFAATESLMMEAVKNGASRQEIHEVIRKLSQEAWKEIDKTGINPLVNLLQRDKIITKFIDRKSIVALMDSSAHIGLAPKKCAIFLKELVNFI